MALTPGTRLGPYDVIARIGAGGMGEVYRAHDTKLDRDVAIKVLPEAFAADPERIARFQREAKTLASLNHPHIAAIHGFEDGDGVRALVMELIEGEDLSQRIARGAIPFDEALPIARQIAEALEAAHEQGVIHRDLKPANVKVRPDGTVKVLDFGLAKLTGGGLQGSGNPALSMSPTITSPAMMTGVGVLLGTAAYMSPEQAKGRDADKRSDIWGFGCVLYEMLTGRRPFDGEDVAEVLAAVIRGVPDWTALPATLPPAIPALLRRCLERDRRKRVADVSTVLFTLDEFADLARTGPTVAAPVPSPTPSWRRAVGLAAGAIVVAAVTAAAVAFVMRPIPPRVSRLSVAPSGAATLTINGSDRDLAITPDGSRLVYVGNGGTQILVRSLDMLDPVAVFTGAPRGLFVSSDGQWVGFVDNNSALKKVAVTGGPAVTLAALDAAPRGGAWLPDDSIIVATANAESGLQRVPPGGGPGTTLTRPDAAKGESDHLWPELLPDGHSVLFTITALSGGLDAAQVAVLDLQTGARKVLVRGGSHAHYVSSGHLVYGAAGTLRAVAFDLARLEPHGPAVPVVPNVVTTGTGGVDAVVAADGTLAYVSGIAGAAAGETVQRSLVWVDRQGGETAIPAPPRAYVTPRLSPDGTRLALHVASQERDIWVWDLARATLTRLTIEVSQDLNPTWMPGGRRLLFSSDRAGAQNLYMQAADGTGTVTRLTHGPNQNPSGVTADGMRVVFHEVTPTRQRDLKLLTLTPTPREEPLLETPFDERDAIVSPDSRWLAYESNSSGRYEIYVRPFPNVGAGQWQVSNAGGVQPLWAPNGRELFYVAADRTLMTVPVGVRGATTWEAGTPKRLLDPRYFTGVGAFFTRQYDISPDGQRFVMIKDAGGAGQTAVPPPSVIVVQHWTEELKRLVPVR